MDKKKISFMLIINFSILICLTLFITVAAFSWFSGQGYQGKTMAYIKQLYIGATNSEVVNYFGINSGENQFDYIRINSNTGFSDSNLQPGSYVYIKTEITNNSETHKSISSLYLQNVEYSASLSSYLFFGKNEPIATRESYNEIAIYNESENKYSISSLPLLTNFTIEPNSKLEVFWYVYIDTSATLEIANAFINLGNVTLTYNS